MKNIITAFLVNSVLFSLPLLAFSQEMNRIEVAGNNLFLNGGNIAWVNIGEDIGPGETHLDLLEEMFIDINEHGGNTMRLWLHVDGSNTPEWNGSNIVGPGEGAIEDLEDILDLAYENDVSLMLCLWSFGMLNIDEDEPHIPARARELLTKQSKLDLYIENSLIPMVEALKGHPAIGSWEIFNEPEGMSEEFGWSSFHHVPMSAIQRFVNHTTAAIKETDPDVLVTNGAWSFTALSDNVVGEHAKNYYSDEELIEKGGKENGTIDFYTVHYYPEHFGRELSPFHYDPEHWGLDKPIVVAEFYTEDTYGISYEYLYERLYDRGYAGALVWQWRNLTRDDYYHIYWPRALVSMKKLNELHPDDIQLEY